MRLCIAQEHTPHGPVICERPAHPTGSYHRATLITDDGDRYIARWFGAHVDLTPVGAAT